MKRSPRSTPTGPGSRGGRFHEREFRLAYHRQWRKDHPDYAERDRRRRRERKRLIRLTKELAEIDGVLTMSDVLRDMCLEELRSMSMRALGDRILIEHSSISRFVRGVTPELTGRTYDAMVAYFGIWTIARHWAKMKKRGRP